MNPPRLTARLDGFNLNPPSINLMLNVHDLRQPGINAKRVRFAAPPRGVALMVVRVAVSGDRHAARLALLVAGRGSIIAKRGTLASKCAGISLRRARPMFCPEAAVAARSPRSAVRGGARRRRVDVHEGDHQSAVLGEELSSSDSASGVLQLRRSGSPVAGEHVPPRPERRQRHAFWATWKGF